MILLITSLPAVCRSWSFAHPHWHLPLSLLENGHSDRGRMIAHCGFEYVSMMVSDIEDFPSLSCWSFVFLISAAVYWGPLTISQMGCLDFWIFQVVDIFWMSILHPSWTCFPILSGVTSLYCFLWCAETFEFDIIMIHLLLPVLCGSYPKVITYTRAETFSPYFFFQQICSLSS